MGKSGNVLVNKFFYSSGNRSFKTTSFFSNQQNKRFGKTSKEKKISAIRKKFLVIFQLSWNRTLNQRHRIIQNGSNTI